MEKKIAYRVRNWKQYNRSLVNRGNLTIWFSEDAIKGWYQKPLRNKKSGRSCIYTEANIHDYTVMPALLATQRDIGKVYADGAYSFKDGFDAITRSGGTTAVRENPSRGQLLRNDLLEEIRKVGGRIA